MATTNGDDDLPPDAPNSTAGAFTPRQEAAALALALGRTVAEAATQSGASQRIIKHWRANLPGFMHRISELRGEITERTLGLLSDAAVDAALALADLLDSESETVRLRAADKILEHRAKLREAVELEARISALEGRRE